MKKSYLALLERMTISGGDFSGFSTEGDLRYRTADGVPYATLWTEFDDTLSIWNQHQTGLAALFTYPVTSTVETVPSIGAVRFEKASEFGVPKSARLGVDYYQLAYGYEDWDLAFRYTWKYLRENPAAEIRAQHDRTLEAHNLEIFYEVMKAIFDNRTRSTEVSGLGYNVYPLYNGTGPKPPDFNGQAFPSNHDHYVVSGNTLLDSEDIEGCIALLAEHGYGRRSGTQIVFLVNQAIIDVVSGFRKGVANNNSKTAKYDWIPAPSQPAQFTVNADGLLGTQPPDTWNGLIISGSYGDAWFVEEPVVPAGYLLAVASGGVANASNLVGIRQHDNPAWRGLRIMPGNQSNYPLIEGFYQFGMGTGIRQRGGAVVMQIKASGSYDIPAAFTQDVLS